MGLFPGHAAKGIVPSEVLALAGTALALIPAKEMLWIILKGKPKPYAYTKGSIISDPIGVCVLDVSERKETSCWAFCGK